jgi:uncharacterized damage-inducible protein DinB
MSVFANPATAAKETADAYISAILELLGEKEPLSVLENLVKTIQKEISELTDDELKYPESPQRWSIIEVIQHLADSELVWAYRLRMVLTQDKPIITGYDQDLWAKKLRYKSANIDESLERLKILRKANLHLLYSLSNEELRRVGIHNERGEESVEKMIRLYAGHDLVHLNQLSRIKAKLIKLNE